MKRYQSVDDYIAGSAGWRDELCKLRAILAATELEETVKWGMPCYTHRGKNVVALAAFKSYVGLWFFQGALLQDQRSVLINAQQGKTKSQRQWRFENLQEIKPRFVKAYIAEAMRVAEQDQHVPHEQKKPTQVPTELAAALGQSARAEKCFAALTAGRQRDYADYIATAKREATKVKRLAKIMPMILRQVGLNDEYRR